MKDYVVLVDDRNKPVGTMEKLAAHSSDTPLHRGFSLFLFNPQGELLLQQRAFHKKTWPGVWSNSVCGHPRLWERSITAARRRLSYELGITQAEISLALPDYRYRIEREGIVENELCPVMIGFTSQKPRPNPEEVAAVSWIPWNKWLKEIKKNPHGYSEWCVEETELLVKSNKI
jgi:isopentenyl-diphosphate Delta-isomerase